MGRFGSKTDEFERDELPRPKPRVRIETEAIPQRKPREQRSTTTYENRRDYKALIKGLVLDRPDMTVHEIAERVFRSGQSASIVTVSNIRAEFKHSMTFLKTRGWREPKP